MNLEPRTVPQQFLDALAIFALFMGAMLGLGSTSSSAPPAVAWVAGGMVAAGALAKAGAALLRVSWAVEPARLVLKGRFGTVREVPTAAVATVGVSATKVAVGTHAYVVHGPVLILRDGAVLSLRKPESGPEGYRQAVEAAREVSDRTGVPLHPPEEARTLMSQGTGAAYGPLRQDAKAFAAAAAALALVFVALVVADRTLGLAPLSGG